MHCEGMYKEKLIHQAIVRLWYISLGHKHEKITAPEQEHTWRTYACIMIHEISFTYLPQNINEIEERSSF